MRRSGWMIAAVFIGSFLLSEALRVLTYHKDLCESFSQWFCGGLLVLWAMTVRTRITVRRLKRHYDPRDRLGSRKDPPRAPRIGVRGGSFIMRKWRRLSALGRRIACPAARA